MLTTTGETLLFTEERAITITSREEQLPTTVELHIARDRGFVRVLGLINELAKTEDCLAEEGEEEEEENTMELMTD